MRKYIKPTIAIIIAGAIIGILGIFWVTVTRKNNLADCVSSGVVGGDLGGDFSLISEDGVRQNSMQILSTPSLIYFGYTFCPDICPFDAARNAEVVDILQAKGLELKAVFITIDPERDSPDILKDFTDYMHPKMVGFTGSTEDIKKAAKAYRVYYAKRPTDDPELYLMDHSVLSYLVIPGRGFVDFFRSDAKSIEIAEKTACFLRAASHNADKS